MLNLCYTSACSAKYFNERTFMSQAKRRLSLFLSILVIFGFIYNIQMIQNKLPQFCENHTITEQMIRHTNNPVKETAIVQKTNGRPLTIEQKNQNRLSCFTIVFLVVLAAFIWKGQTLSFSQVWYTLEQYRKYICRISVRRGPPAWNV